MKKCLICGKDLIGDTENCMPCNDWSFLIYYKYVIYPHLLTNKAENWHENC
jgi:hypothetical protein